MTDNVQSLFDVSREMAQIMFEFGAAEPQSVLDAITLAIGEAKYQVKVLKPEDIESVAYISTQDSIESAGKKLRQGEIASFIVYPNYPNSKMIRYAMMNSPDSWGENFPLWYGAIECVDVSIIDLFNRLLSIPLQFLSVSMEESLDLRKEHLVPSKFPWNHAQLIIGAVKHDVSKPRDWVIKNGPAFADSGVK